MDEKDVVIDVMDKGLLPPPPAAKAPAAAPAVPRSPSRWRLHAALVVAQAGFAGYEVLSRRTLQEGTSVLVFSFYRNCVGFLVLRVFANFIEKKNKPVLNFPALFATLLLGFFGVAVSELCYLEGLKHTTPTFASAMRNAIPVFTFILALIFRMEKVDTERVQGIAKLGGSILVICGWMLLVIYEGNKVLESHLSFLPHGEAATLKEAQHSIRLGAIHVKLDNQKYGASFLVISCLSFSVFLILQGFIMEKYAAPISFASFACFFAIVQVGVAASFHSHDPSWSKFSISEGISIAYAGIIGSGLVFGIQSWGVKQGGPMLVAAYQPLETISSIILAFFLLKESLHLGSIVGGGITMVGLYLMIWAKEREQRFAELSVVQDFQGASATNTQPPSDLSFAVNAENGVPLSVATSAIQPGDSMEQNLDQRSMEQNPAWQGSKELGLSQSVSMERNASWVSTEDTDLIQPASMEDQTPTSFMSSSNSREQTLSEPVSTEQDPLLFNMQKATFVTSSPLSKEQTLSAPVSTEQDPSRPEQNLSSDKALALREAPGLEVKHDSSDTSAEVASTGSNFSRWNSARTSRANSVRSIPSRLNSAPPSRVNSIRSIASRMGSARRSIASDSSSGSGQIIFSPRTSTSSD